MGVPYIDANGDVSVRVDLQHSSNVYVVDQDNYWKMQSGQPYQYFGGYYENTPVTINVGSMNPTRWYLIVDNGSGEQYSYQWFS